MSELRALIHFGSRDLPSGMRVLRAVLCEDDPRTLELPSKPTWMRRDPCAYCGRPAVSWDHLVAMVHLSPIDRKAGGARRGERFTLQANYTRACRRCNGTKGHRSPLIFLARRFRRFARLRRWIAAGRPR